MTRQFKIFFNPKVEVYYYDSKSEIITSDISDIFSSSSGFLSGNDMRGFFNDKYTFEIERISPVLGSFAFRPKLIGQISELENKTEIKTTIRTSFMFYILFVLTILLGIFGLFICAQTYSLKSLLTSISIIVVGPLLTIALSNFNVGLLTDRYKRYIDSPLRK